MDNLCLLYWSFSWITLCSHFYCIWLLETFEHRIVSPLAFNPSSRAYLPSKNGSNVLGTPMSIFKRVLNMIQSSLAQPIKIILALRNYHIKKWDYCLFQINWVYLFWRKKSNTIVSLQNLYLRKNQLVWTYISLGNNSDISKMEQKLHKTSAFSWKYWKNYWIWSKFDFSINSLLKFLRDCWPYLRKKQQAEVCFKQKVYSGCFCNKCLKNNNFVVEKESKPQNNYNDALPKNVKDCPHPVLGICTMPLPGLNFDGTEWKTYLLQNENHSGNGHHLFLGSLH